MFRMTLRTERFAKKADVYKSIGPRQKSEKSVTGLHVSEFSYKRLLCFFLYNLLFLNCYSLGVASIVDTCFTALHNGQLPVPSSEKNWLWLFSVGLPSINTGNKSPNCILFGLCL